MGRVDSHSLALGTDESGDIKDHDTAGSLSSKDTPGPSRPHRLTDGSYCKPTIPIFQMKRRRLQKAEGLAADHTVNWL